MESTSSPIIEFIQEVVLKRELRNVYFSTLKSVKDYTLKYISSSIYISPDQPEPGQEVRGSDPNCADMLTFRRFMDKWERDFAGPLFDEFLGHFQASLSPMLEDPEFHQTILPQQLSRDH